MEAPGGPHGAIGASHDEVVVAIALEIGDAKLVIPPRRQVHGAGPTQPSRGHALPVGLHRPGFQALGGGTQADPGLRRFLRLPAQKGAAGEGTDSHVPRHGRSILPPDLPGHRAGEDEGHHPHRRSRGRS